MSRTALIDNTLEKIKKLPDFKIREVNDFADFLFSKIDDNTIRDGVYKLASESSAFHFLNEEPELYGVEDLKERYK